MKKLKLNLSGAKALSKLEQRLINGGYGGSCGYKHPSGAAWCGLSYSQAYGAFQNMGGNWCCDSCGSSSYCG